MLTRGEMFERAADAWARLMEWQPTTTTEAAEKRMQWHNLTHFMAALLEMPPSGTPCGPCIACHVRDEEPCPFSCICHEPVEPHEQVGRKFYRPTRRMPVALAGYEMPTWCVETTEAY
jgi:hypothetical protein